jgi:hypothetical protein
MGVVLARIGELEQSEGWHSTHCFYFRCSAPVRMRLVHVCHCSYNNNHSTHWTDTCARSPDGRSPVEDFVLVDLGGLVQECEPPCIKALQTVLICLRQELLDPIRDFGFF